MPGILMKRVTAAILLISLTGFFGMAGVSVNAESSMPVKEKTGSEGAKLFSSLSADEYDNQELIIYFQKKAARNRQLQIIKQYGATELSHTDTGNFSLIKLDKGSAKKAAAELGRDPLVKFAEPNVKYENTYKPNDKYYSKQWYLPKINMPKAWNQTKGSSSVTVAVIDNGMQVSHPDLKGKIVHQKNIVRGSRTITARDHGTHVAGIIAASMNKSGTAGIAPKVKIMPVQVFGGKFAAAYDIANGIIYAADNGAKIINLSLGSESYSSAVDYAVEYAHKKGAVIIAAAGNESTSAPSYPAALQYVLAVSATDSKDKDASFSNYGSYINYSAPGEDIYSTVSGSKYQYMDGTSMAAPVVSGVAALVLSRNPFLTPNEVEKILNKSVRFIRIWPNRRRKSSGKHTGASVIHFSFGQFHSDRE